MKIAWYTPFSVMSAIGRFSALVAKQLALAGHDVTVMRSEYPSRAMRQLETIACDLPVVWAQSLGHSAAQTLSEFDVVAYNLGDQFVYHQLCFEHLELVPGLVVLHDYVLHNALNGYCQHRPGSMLTYEGVLNDECGPQVVQQMQEWMRKDPNRWWRREIARHPVLRWVLRRALGVTVHSQFTESIVRTRVACPTRTIPLAYDGHNAPPRPFRDVNSRVRLLTVGHVNPNKRAKQVVEVLDAHDELRSRCEYHIVGPVEVGPRQNIEAAVEKGRPELRVRLTGRVESAELQQEFADADVIICLRNPAMEGGSASVIEGMLTGKPVIVSDTGCFSEIPSEYVYKIDVRDESNQLAQVLQQILSDYPRALQRGHAAGVWASQRHSPRHYADQFAQFAQFVLYDQPVVRTVDRIGDCLRLWGALENDALIDRVDRAVCELFREGRRGRRSA